MSNFSQRIQDLIEIFPLIKQNIGKVVVIKYGGSAMKNEQLQKNVIQDILLLFAFGIKPVLVHGGGPIINQWLERFNIKPKFENGIRITNQETMEIVEMVLAGKVNKGLVSLLNKNDSHAIGLSGQDGNLVHASPLFDCSDNLVGQIESTNISILTLLINSGYIPVIASIASGLDGRVYNINADTFAGAIAKALNAEKLIFLTDTPGIMSDLNDNNTLIKHLNVLKALELKEKNIISGGMIPKLECCIDVLHSNVKSVHIIDGRFKHSLLLEIFTNKRIGSMLTL